MTKLTMEEKQQLIRMALAAREKAYAPYSDFMVGAALRAADGRIFTGCNVENAAFTPTSCAERTALFKAVAEGVTAFTDIAVVGSRRGEVNRQITSPCGVCRQALFDKHHIFAAMTAFHLYDWYRNNRFCGRCGTPVVPDPSHKERMLSCPQCGNTIYPKICPAIIVGVIDGERILLTKYAGRNNPNYALIAGFTEIGETAEETVMREVYEEVGVRVKNLRYYKTQPWGMASDLLIGYYAELDGDPSITLDRNELSTGLWMDRKDIIIEDEDFSLTREMIVRFAKTGRAVLN